MVYIQDLNFKTDYLGSIPYRMVVFRVQDFLKFQDPRVNSTNYYQFKTLLTFLRELQKKSLITSFTDNEFRILAT